MKLKYECIDCNDKMIMEITGYKNIKELSFKWTCKKCGKINEEYSPIIG